MKFWPLSIALLLWNGAALAGTPEIERPRPAGEVPAGHLEWMHAEFLEGGVGGPSADSGTLDAMVVVGRGEDRHWELGAHMALLHFQGAPSMNSVRIGNLSLSRETRQADGDYTRWGVTVPTSPREHPRHWSPATWYGIQTDIARSERFYPGYGSVELVKGRRASGRLGIFHLTFAPKWIFDGECGEILVRYGTGVSTRGRIAASVMVSGVIRGLLASSMNQPDKNYVQTTLGLQVPMGGFHAGVFLGLPLDGSMKALYDHTVAARITID